MSNLSIKNHVIEWEPGTSNVLVTRDHDYYRERSLPYSWGACNSEIRESKDDDFFYLPSLVYATALSMIIRDKCDAMAVHKALLKLEEYKSTLALDMLLLR